MSSLFRLIAAAVALTLLASACSSGSSGELAGDESVVQNPSGVDRQDALDDDEADDGAGSASTIVRTERAVEAAEACARIESGYLDLLRGEPDSARPHLEIGAGLTMELGAQNYLDRGQALVDVLAATDAHPADMQSAADAVLAECAADGFERLG